MRVCACECACECAWVSAVFGRAQGLCAMFKYQCQGQLRGARRAGLHGRQNKGVVAVLSPGPLASLSQPLRPVSGMLWAGQHSAGARREPRATQPLAPIEALPGALSPRNGSHGQLRETLPEGSRCCGWPPFPSGSDWSEFSQPGGGCEVLCRAVCAALHPVLSVIHTGPSSCSSYHGCVTNQYNTQPLSTSFFFSSGFCGSGNQEDAQHGSRLPSVTWSQSDDPGLCGHLRSWQAWIQGGGWHRQVTR